jgi:hypothetical protein
MGQQCGLAPLGKVGKFLGQVSLGAEFANGPSFVEGKEAEVGGEE